MDRNWFLLQYVNYNRRHFSVWLIFGSAAHGRLYNAWFQGWYNGTSSRYSHLKATFKKVTDNYILKIGPEVVPGTKGWP